MAILNLGNNNSAFSGSFSGSFQGDGSGLTGITATAGSTSGRVVFTTTSGELTTESGFDYNSSTNQLTVESLNVTHLTSSFITSSRIHTSGSNIFGDDTTDTQTLIGTTKMTGSAEITGSLSISGSSSDFLLFETPINKLEINSGNIKMGKDAGRSVSDNRQVIFIGHQAGYTT